MPIGRYTFHTVSAQDNKPELNPFEAAERQRAVLLRVVRIAFIVLLTTVTLLNILQLGTAGAGTVLELTVNWAFKVTVVIILATVVIAVDVLTPTKKISTISSIFLGLLAGIIATVALGFLMDLVAQTYEITPPIVATAKVFMGICLSYLGISIVLQTQDDFRLVIPYVEFSKQIRGARPLLLDTSVLIDGRFIEIAQTGLIQSPVVIPRFVVNELQLLADNSDKLKRNRGRRGLEMVGRLQRLAKIDVSIEQTAAIGPGVDQMLVELARQMQGMIVTGDLGLTRVAQIQDIPVLNLNDLAVAVKPTLLPGEQIPLILVRPGEQPQQGVGYLDDGTMVVVEDGAAAIDRQVTVAVVSSLQTAAGRMIFARLVRSPSEHGESGGAHQVSPAGSVSEPVLGPGDPENLEEARADGPGVSLSGSSDNLAFEAGASGTGEEPGPSAPLPEGRAPGGPFPPNPPRRANRYRNPRR